MSFAGQRDQKRHTNDTADDHQRSEPNKLRPRDFVAKPVPTDRRCREVEKREQRHDAGDRHRLGQNRRRHKCRAGPGDAEDDVGDNQGGKRNRCVDQVQHLRLQPELKSRIGNDRSRVFAFRVIASSAIPAVEMERAARWQRRQSRAAERGCVLRVPLYPRPESAKRPTVSRDPCSSS
jgi:hypothetical protein